MKLCKATGIVENTSWWTNDNFTKRSTVNGKLRSAIFANSKIAAFQPSLSIRLERWLPARIDSAIPA